MFDFQNPSRQSIRGIAVLFGFNSYKIIKSLFLAIAAFSYSFIKNGKVFGLSQNKIVFVIALVFLFILFRSILEYLNFKFHIVGDDFMLSKGILNKEKITVSKSKIQNIYIRQNILQQIINVVQLDIETAGDAKAEVKITALSRNKAKALKEELLSHVNTLNKTETVLENRIEQQVYYKASIKKLVLEGFSENHIKSFLIIAGFVGGLYSTYEDFIAEIKLNDKFDALIIQNENSIGALIFTSLAILLMTLLISILFSIVKTFLLNFELQVIEHKNTIEIKKGLFNKVAIVLSPTRIQNIEVVNNRLKRYFGLNTLRIKQAMVDKKLQKHFSIIGLDQLQVNYLVEKLMQRFSPILENGKPERYYIRVLFLIALIPIVLFNAIGFLILENQFWIINLFIIPLLALMIYWKYQKAYYNLNDNMLIVGSGSISTITELLETHKIQAVSTNQTVFQKLRNIATVKVYTASKVTEILYVKESRANAIVNFLLYQVESQRKDWM
ncbi:PH domain-containing protein [Lacinutrix jangbogonensis]|uniref:PH domain-containing protein n=1 Tax=Lacinutrix jangbogonensis TaxID=1469557 RepID=UPI00053D9D6B|nr:PH domain-containing protein [Lacinutrix jangbogonensis]